MTKIINLISALQFGVFDPDAGIAHNALAGSKAFRLHITKIQPGAKVMAHVHATGEELYVIYSGSGSLYTGFLDEENGSVLWNKPTTVETGDTFSIQPEVVHQLHNTGDEPLILIFGCPDSHLKSDRTITDGYPKRTLSLIISN